MGGEVYRFSPPRMSFQLLYLDGRPATRVPVGPADLGLPPLKPREWCMFQRDVYFRPEGGRTPYSYRLEYCALPVGITMYEVRNVVIRELIVQGFQLDGINAHDGVFDALLKKVTCRGNARSGICVGGASRVQIVDCLVGGNGEAQLRTEGYSHTRLVSSRLLSDTSAAANTRRRKRGDGGNNTNSATLTRSCQRGEMSSPLSRALRVSVGAEISRPIPTPHRPAPLRVLLPLVRARPRATTRPPRGGRSNSTPRRSPRSRS